MQLKPGTNSFFPPQDNGGTMGVRVAVKDSESGSKGSNLNRI